MPPTSLLAMIVPLKAEASMVAAVRKRAAIPPMVTPCGRLMYESLTLTCEAEA